MLLELSPDPFSRDQFTPGHITTSGLIVSPDATRILIRPSPPPGTLAPPRRPCRTRRRRLSRSRGRTRGASRRPAVLVLGGPLAGADVHGIPAKGHEPYHLHHDLLFCFQAPHRALHGLRGIASRRLVHARRVRPLRHPGQRPPGVASRPSRLPVAVDQIAEIPHERHLLLAQRTAPDLRQVLLELLQTAPAPSGRRAPRVRQHEPVAHPADGRRPPCGYPRGRRSSCVHRVAVKLDHRGLRLRQPWKHLRLRAADGPRCSESSSHPARPRAPGPRRASRSCVDMLTARTRPLSRTACNSSRTCGVKCFARVTPRKWNRSM